MKIEFIDTNLHEIDEINVQAMVVSAFMEERPFYGMAGLIDWRMCATFSRMSLENFVTSDLGEAVMVPAYNRLNANAVIMLGLGSEKTFGLNDVRALGIRIGALIHGLHLSDLLIDLPGSPLSQIDAEKRMRLLMETLKAEGVLGQQNIRLFIAEKARLHGKLRAVTRRYNPRNIGNKYG